jgi:hypothetical protein
MYCLNGLIIEVCYRNAIGNLISVNLGYLSSGIIIEFFGISLAFFINSMFLVYDLNVYRERFITFRI